jgi:hypothetical protein
MIDTTGIDQEQSTAYVPEKEYRPITALYKIGQSAERIHYVFNARVYWTITFYQKMNWKLERM